MRFFTIPIALIMVFWVQGAALAEDAPSEQQAEAPSGEETTGDAPAAADAADAEASSAPAQQETADAPPDGEQASADLLSEAQLEQIVAPIALYPDPLLSEVLIAATYPLEVVQAERWVEKNKDLKGEALDEALNEQDWDDSIKSLVLVPDVLSMMNNDLDWTQQLGNAVLAQQADVMDAIQNLRALAQENGKLESNPQQTVNVTQQVTQSGQEKDVIVIQPTEPNTVYVPYYEPQVVYGGWPYPSYQPYYFPPPPGYAFGNALLSGLAWSAGFAIGNAIWGNGFDWGRNDIRVNVNRNYSPNININNNRVNVQNWQHNSYHRRGVEYNNTNVRNKFSNNKNNIANRPGNNRPGNNRPGDRRPGDGGFADKRPGGGNLAGNRPGGDRRPTVGDMEAALKNKPGSGQRPNREGGNRPTTKDIGAALDRKPGGGQKPKIGSGNRPGAQDRQAALKNKPAANKRPDVSKRPQAKPQAKRPSGNALKKRDGGKARSASSRGKQSVGKRSATNLSARRPQARARSGGHRGGGHRGGGRRR